jgi:hypothetical protein
MAVIHKMSHVQDFYVFHIGTDLAKMHFGQISTNMKCVGFYVGAPHHHDTSLQDNDGTTKAFSYPSGMCIVALESLHCVYGKKTGHFCSKLRREKPIFECTIGAWCFVFFLFERVQRWPSIPTARIACCFSTNDCVFCKKTGAFGPNFGKNSPFSHIMMIVTFCQLVCPLNEYNDGRLCSCQGQLVLLTPMIFFWNQSSHICCDGLSVTLTDVSCFDFWNLAVARGVLSCLSPTSTCACHDSCYLHLFLSVVIVIIRWAK